MKYDLMRGFILGLFITGMLVGIALAEEDSPNRDEDRDGVDDDMEEKHKRELEVNVEDDQIEIKSELKSETIESHLEIRVKLEEDDGLEIKVQYESSGDNEEDEQEKNDDEIESSSSSEMEFEITINKLIEYGDDNSNGLYDPDTDTTYQELLLNSFQNPENIKTKNDDDTILHEIEITSTDGVFTIRFFVSEGFTEVGNEILTPTEVKFDIEINNFAYVNGTSQLALKTILESEDDYEHEEDTDDENEGYSEDEEGTQVKSGGETGFFTWKETAEVDGETKPVIASKLMTYENDEDEQILYLNYKRGTNIFHDPKIGIESTLFPEDEINLALYILIFSAAIAGLAAVAIIWKIKTNPR